MCQELILSRFLPINQLDQARVPSDLIITLVNSMRKEFSPCERGISLSIRLDRSYLLFIMSLDEIIE